MTENHDIGTHMQSALDGYSETFVDRSGKHIHLFSAREEEHPCYNEEYST